MKTMLSTTLAALSLLLAGCGDTYLRAGPTDTTPAVFFCTSWAAMASHLEPGTPEYEHAAAGYTRGMYNSHTNAVYIMTNDADSLTVGESLVLMHELLHASHFVTHDNAWALLKLMGANQHPAGRENQ